MHKVYCYGEALIDFIGTPSGANIQNTDSFVKKPGGAPANVAVALARLQTPVAFIGKVGADPFGDFLEQTFLNEGVDIAHLIKSDNPAHQTSLAFVSLDDQKERHFSFFRSPGADTQLDRKDLSKIIFDGPSIFHFGSISLIGGPTKECCFALIEEAQKNSLISYDPNLRLTLWPSESVCRETVINSLHYADILKLSEEELLFLSEKSNLDEAINFIRGKFEGILLVSMGAQGAMVYLGNQSIKKSAQPCKVVDTTGAGDAFLGGFLTAVSRLWQGVPLTIVDCRKALELAVTTGSYAVQDYGAMSALPKYEEIDWQSFSLD